MSAPANRFVMRQGPTPGQVIDLSKGDLGIGRDLSNDIVINDVEVSRKHARLQLQGSRFRLEDLGSTNGTFVNGQRLIAPHILVPGDVISLGESVSLVYEAAPLDPAATQVSPAASASAIPVPPFTPDYSPEPKPKPQPAQQPPPRATPAPTPQPAAKPTAYAPLPQTPKHAAQSPAQYAGQVPAGPEIEVFAPEETPRKKPVRQWLLAGGGCLVILLCFVIALLVFIDQPWSDTGLYCTPPFDIIFSIFGVCP